MKVHGKDVILSIDEIAVACAKSCELNVQQDFIEVSNPVSGRWKKYIPSGIGWTASVSMMAVTMENPQAWLEEMKNSQAPLTMRYYDTELNIYQIGEVWISSWQSGASVGDLVTFSVQLQGNGPLEPVSEDAISLLTMTGYEGKAIQIMLPLGTDIRIVDDSTKTLRAKTVYALGPVEMKLKKSGINPDIMVVDLGAGDVSEIVANNGSLKGHTIISPTASGTVRKLPEGAYTLLCDDAKKTGLEWTIKGYWRQ